MRKYKHILVVDHSSKKEIKELARELAKMERSAQVMAFPELGEIEITSLKTPKMY